MKEERGVISFLETKLSREKLKNALEVIEDFKKRESEEEWLWIPFEAWSKLEQLEEFLEFLVKGKELKEDSARIAKRRGINLLKTKEDEK